jgi:hypothetical protein
MERREVDPDYVSDDPDHRFTRRPRREGLPSLAFMDDGNPTRKRYSTAGTPRCTFVGPVTISTPAPSRNSTRSHQSSCVVILSAGHACRFGLCLRGMPPTFPHPSNRKDKAIPIPATLFFQKDKCFYNSSKSAVRLTICQSYQFERNFAAAAAGSRR